MVDSRKDIRLSAFMIAFIGSILSFVGFRISNGVNAPAHNDDEILKQLTDENEIKERQEPIMSKDDKRESGTRHFYELPDGSVYVREYRRGVGNKHFNIDTPDIVLDTSSMRVKKFNAPKADNNAKVVGWVGISFIILGLILGFFSLFAN